MLTLAFQMVIASPGFSAILIEAHVRAKTGRVVRNNAKTRVSTFLHNRLIALLHKFTLWLILDKITDAINLSMCSDRSWCCGTVEEAGDCCERGDGFVNWLNATMVNYIVKPGTITVTGPTVSIPIPSLS